MYDQHIYYIIYYFIGLSYWAINIFVRKLHLKNESGDGWFLAPLWVIFWPMFFFMLIWVKILNIKNKKA